MLAVAALGLLTASGARAQTDLRGDGSVEVTADEVEFERERELYTASGRVEIRQGGRRIEADWAAFSQRTERGVASGNVRVFDGELVLYAEFAEFSVTAEEGLVFDVDVDTGEGGFRIRADELTKTGAQTYSLVDADFTTCRCPDRDARPPWKIRTRSADVKLGGYAKTRNSTVDILGVPAIWLPWMIFPVKTERESGLLFPEFAFGGRNGFEVGVPIFWAAADPLNIIFTPSYLQKRGFKPELEFDYVLGERSGGRLFGTFIHDDSIEALEDAGLAKFSPNRWAVIWEHDQYLPAGWTARADVKAMSDNQYAFDFADLERYRRDRFLQSSVFSWNHWLADGSLGFTGALHYADDLQNPDNQDRDDVVLQRLPSLQTELLSNRVPKVGGFVGGFGVEYDYFAQFDDPLDFFGIDENDAWVSLDHSFVDSGIDAIINPDEFGRNPADPHCDDLDLTADGDLCDQDVRRGPELNGTFQEGEPVGTGGSRLSFFPKLAYPVRLLDLFEFYPEVGYRQTLYGTEREGFAQRGLLTARADLSMRIRGRLLGARHTMEPMLGWAFVDPVSQTGQAPRFVPRTAVPQERLRQLDLDNVVLDAADRVKSANRLRLGLGNRFTMPGGDIGMELNLSGEYDFDEDRFGWLIAEGSVMSGLPFRSQFHVAWDPEEKQIADALMDFSFLLPRRLGLLGTRYRFIRKIPQFWEEFSNDPARFGEFEDGFQRVEQIDAFTVIRLTDSWSLHYAATYSLESELLIGNRGGIDYFSRCGCWAAGFEVLEDRQRGVQYRFRYSILGLGKGSRRARYGNQYLGSQDF